MSIYKGNTLVAGGSQALPLLSFMWADHKLNHPSWLRADTFSWQSGAVYQAVYQHLVDDINEMSKWALWKDDNDNYAFTKKIVPHVGETTYANDTLTTEVGVITATGSSNGNQTITVNNVVYTQRQTFSIDDHVETIEGINVIVCTAEDGHKICLTLTDEESDINAIYNTTGVAWYYLLDIGNQRFKLPRTKFGFTGLRDSVGDYVEPSVPNITGTIGFARSEGSAKGNVIYNTGAFYDSDTYTSGGYTAFAQDGNSPAGNKRALFDASYSNSAYKDGATVQPPATEMYLYFYVGEFTQTALENTAGVVTEDINELKAHEIIAFQAPTAANNYTWYRKYADGWVEQGGIYTITVASFANFNLIVPMADSNYTATGTSAGSTTSAYPLNFNKSGFTTTTFSAKTGVAGSGDFYWQVSGMAAN